MLNGTVATVARRGICLATVWAAVALVCAQWSPALAGTWKGKVSDVGGVKTVANPAVAMEPPVTVKLEHLWTVGGDTEDEDEFFGVIADIEIDNSGNVYLLDSQLAEVKIYTKDGELIRSIGRQGEGPGEFRLPNAMFFTKEGNIAVLQTVPGKIVLLTPDGKPAGDFPLPQPADGGFQILGGGQARSGNIVLFLGRTAFQAGEGKWSRSDFLVSVDTKGTQLSQYAAKTKTIVMADATLRFSDWDTFERRWELGPDGKVYACESYPNYEITVFNKAGAVEKKITREYGHQALGAKEKDMLKRIMDFSAQQIPGCKVVIDDNAKDIESIHVRDDGNIWVLTSTGARTKPAGSLGVFDVLNPEGQYVKAVTLMGEGDPLSDLYLLVKNRLYVVTDFLQAAMAAQGMQGAVGEEEEAEPMAVRCFKLEGDLLSAR